MEEEVFMRVCKCVFVNVCDSGCVFVSEGDSGCALY